MLTPEQLDHYPDALVDLYAQCERDILADMARRINTYNYFIPAAEHQYRKLAEMNNVHDDILKALAAQANKSKEELLKLMKEAGQQSLNVDDAIYNKAGLATLPLGQSAALLAVLDAGLKKTNGLFTNLTKTTANTATKQFENALDRAYMQITSGAFDANSAIRTAIKDLSSQGIASIQYPSGHIDHMDVAVRRAALTGVSQTALKMQEARADEMGCDLVEVTAHAGARPAHAAWQGGIYSRSGNSDQYENFEYATGYGTGAGLGGWNCKHSWFPYFEGISKRAYTQKELDGFNDKSMEYNGKKMTKYEASQKQRYIERQLRRWKREKQAMKAAGLDTAEASAKIAKWQNTQKDFLKQTGLKRQHDREQVAGFGKSQAQKVKQNVARNKVGMNIGRVASAYSGSTTKPTVPLFKSKNGAYKAGLNDVAKLIMDRAHQKGIECVAMVNRHNGSYLYNMGTRGAAGWSNEMDLLAVRHNGQTYTMLHNHPTGGKPTVADIFNFGLYETIKESIILLGDGKALSLRWIGEHVDFQTMVKDARELSKRYMQTYQRKVNKGQMTVAEANAHIELKVAQDMIKKYGIEKVRLG